MVGNITPCAPIVALCIRNQFFHEEIKLGFKCPLNIIYALEVFCLARLWSKLLAGQWVNTIMERNFKNLICIKVSGVALKISFSKYNRFNASANTPVACFLKCESQAEQIDNCRIIIIECRMTAGVSGCSNCKAKSFLIDILMIAEGYAKAHLSVDSANSAGKCQSLHYMHLFRLP